MRKAGILLAVSSLPSPHGIGDFGPSAYQFINLLKRSKTKLWQVLPLNPLGYGSSPYQPYSSKAMDELYVSLELLVKDGLLKKAPRFHSVAEKVDYDAVRRFKAKLLWKAFKHFDENRGYQRFINANPWVYTYAVFLTLKKHNNLIIWNEWPKDQQRWIQDHTYDLTPLKQDIAYEMFLQYILVKQWRALKSYAKKQGVEIVGDIPIYVGIDSDDVWSNQANFLLDKDCRPTFIAGVPPDYFSKTGQRWGNPIYDWDYMQKDGFKFWLSRLSYNADLYDYIRIDHFRAFDTYWKIPSSCPTAEVGEWIEAPGYALFDTIFAQYPDFKIIAEDLGDLRPQVLTLRDHYRFPGMKIVQFTFNPNEKQDREMGHYRPLFHDRENMIVYTGTHDNQTVKGWFCDYDRKTKARIVSLLKSWGYKTEDIPLAFCAYTLDNIADTAILPMQDILSYGDRARMNRPGTIGSPNWEWKMASFDDFKKRIPTLRKMIRQSGR